ncbi:DUF2207 domain-containing protein [Aestuariivirga sp.]|uniref:DUF2207 domain-containing protein n=1 Tax=Aestuariivirga sp. TaxID=2650926 RepID=UPI0039E2BBF5
MRRLFALLACLICLAAPVWADERITSFQSDVTVNADASLSVQETIAANAEGDDIRHGIFRDFPTTYTNRNGQTMRVGFDVASVTRDGRSEPYTLESIDRGTRVKIGDADTLIPYGPHVYVITYKTTRQIGFYDQFDELYWNVTGNGWKFPIDRASVLIHLPEGANILQHAEYTGYAGSRGNDAQVLDSSGNIYRAETTRPLAAGEGFTVAVGWQKGILQPPTDSQKWWWWLSDNAGIFMSLLTLLGAGLYYLYAWARVGRDPPKGTIVPLFTPPPVLGPAGARFVWKQDFDNRTFAAALVSLAVKGRLKIFDDDGDYAIEKKPDSGQPLTAAEKTLYSLLPAGRTQLKQKNNAVIRPIRSGLQKALENEYVGSVFVRNISWFITGALISVAGIALAALLLPGEDRGTAFFSIVWMGVWWTVIIGMVWGAVAAAWQAKGILKKLGSVLGMLFFVPFIIAGVAVPVGMFFSGGSLRVFWIIAAAALLAVMNVVFLHLLRAPTVSGRTLLDQLEGFRMYMKTAEEKRLDMLNPPEKTPELFERYLPYALALDCENEWNAKFASVLAAAAVAGAAAPLWYSGSHWNPGNIGGFTDSLGSSLASTLSTASTAPGSSSGSGGGGSSGGGGGGGGGGGW